MLEHEDQTYNQLREKSIHQWFDEISDHEDIVVRGGVKVTKDYMEYLQNKIMKLENKNKLKDEYLKKIKGKLLKQ